MIRSMTGFGAASGPVGSAQVSVELRTVNHRFFNPTIKLPAALSRWEGDVRELLRRAIGRGHATLVARVEREGTPGVLLNEARVAEYVRQIRALQERFALSPELDAGTVLRLPEVLGTQSTDEIGGSVEELSRLVQSALDALMTMREAEGARLARSLADRVATIEDAVARLARRAPERLVAERERLRDAVRELAGGVDVDPARLAQEIAVLAERLDVSEEIDRFQSHLAAFRETLARSGTEPIGKRLGFLLQEMLRETNTTGSKARDAIMLHEVVAVKEELERIAEQVENLE
jgi:uncharacterized protein (TIGR00255 family)